MPITDPRAKGSALLAVLWLSVALSTIALTVASTVRGEIDRAYTASDDTRAYFLAQSAIQRSILYIEWGRMFPPNYYQPGQPPMVMHFPQGDVTVQVISESSKLNLNESVPADFFRLFAALGVPVDQAQAFTAAIVARRTGAFSQPITADPFNLLNNPTFRAAQASFQEVEDLLQIPGITPDLFYGTWDRDDRVQPPRLVPRVGLRDCVSVYSNGSLDVNTTPLPVLIASGLVPEAALAIEQQRSRQPFPNLTAVRAFTQGMGPAGGRLMLGGASMFTIRATAQPRSASGVLTDMHRSVSALVKFQPSSGEVFQIVRWYDRG